MMAVWVLVRHYNFSAEYVESMPPIERDIYLNFGVRENEEQNEAMNQK